MLPATAIRTVQQARIAYMSMSTTLGEYILKIAQVSKKRKIERMMAIRSVRTS